MVIFAVWLFLTVFDNWYTVGTVLVDPWRLVHQRCTNRQKQSKAVKRQPKQQKWPFPDVKFRVATLCTISKKAIRFRHPDYNPDRAQKLTSSSTSRHVSTHNISSKSVHAFLSNLANRQTDRQARAKHLPPPLSEVNNFRVLPVSADNSGNSGSNQCAVRQQSEPQNRFSLLWR